MCCTHLKGHLQKKRGRENSSAGVVQYAYGIKATVHIRENHKEMTTYIDENPRPPIHAIVIESEAALLQHLDRSPPSISLMYSLCL